MDLSSFNFLEFYLSARLCCSNWSLRVRYFSFQTSHSLAFCSSLSYSESESLTFSSLNLRESSEKSLLEATIDSYYSWIFLTLSASSILSKEIWLLRLWNSWEDTTDSLPGSGYPWLMVTFYYYSLRNCIYLLVSSIYS